MFQCQSKEEVNHDALRDAVEGELAIEVMLRVQHL